MNLKKLLFIGTVSLIAFNAFASDGYMEIDALEAKKKELLSVRNGNPVQESEILANAKKEYDEAAYKIDQELLRIAETDANGNMLADVRKRRAEEKLAIKAEIDQRAKSEIAALKGGDSSYEGQIKAEIQQMENDLKQVRVIDSFEYPELLTLKSYAGDKYYWNTTAKFYIGNNLVFTQNIPLYYEKVSGKAPAQASRSDDATYNDYLDTVDYYDERIRYNDGSIVLEIEYIISACDVDLPSTYTVKINKMRFVNKVNNVVIQDVIPSTTVYTLKMTPAVDIRTVQERTGNYTGNKTMTASVEPYNSNTGNKTVSNQPVPINSTPTKADLLNKTNQERFLLGVSFGSIPFYPENGFDENSMITANAFITVPIISNLFVQMDMGIIPTPFSFGEYVNDSGLIFDFMFGAGANYRLNLWGYKPNLYVSGAIGFGCSDELYSVKKYHYGEEALLFLGRVSAGVDFPIGNIVTITSDYSLWFIEDLTLASNYSIGFSIDLN